MLTHPDSVTETLLAGGQPPPINCGHTRVHNLAADGEKHIRTEPPHCPDLPTRKLSWSPIARPLSLGYGRVNDSLKNFDWLAKFILRLSIGFMFFSGAVGKLGDLGKFTAMFNGLGIPGAPAVAPAVAIIELVVAWR